MKKWLAVLFITPFLLLFSAWLLLSPSHERDWRADQIHLPRVTITDNQITVSNVRNWSYTKNGDPTSTEWRDIIIRKEQVEKLYFVMEPFGGFSGIAHTMLSVELTDGSAYVISVEARRESTEGYSAWKGALFPIYEYLFVWATERDMYGNSHYYNNDPVYMYELDLSPDQIWTVVRALAIETEAVTMKPRWYNTILANCTNVLARTINKHLETKLPWNIARVMPGYSEEYLYDQGLLNTGKSLSTLTEEGFISPFIDTAYQETDPQHFSSVLREER